MTPAALCLVGLFLEAPEAGKGFLSFESSLRRGLEEASQDLSKHQISHLS